MALTIKLEGAWVDVHTEQTIAPPDDLLQILNPLPHADSFGALRSFVLSKK
jgi:hypothetical protein